MPKVNKLTTNQKNAIIQKSPLTLPNNPTQSGYSSAQIKQKMAGMVTDTTDSVLAVLDTKLEEIDGAFDDVLNDVQLTSVENKHIIQYNGPIAKWENTAALINAETDIDNLQNQKADTTYVDAQLLLKADLISPALTGTPTAPTAVAGTNNTQIATTAYTDDAVATLENYTDNQLATKIDLTQKGAANGVATLGADGRMPISQLPNGVFDSLHFAGVVNLNTTINTDISPVIFADALSNNRSPKGYYYVATAPITLTASASASNVDGVYYRSLFRTNEEGQTSTFTLNIERNDWFILTNVQGTGTFDDNYILTYAIVNNTYEAATTSTSGITQLSSSTSTATTGNNVITDGVLSGLIGNTATTLGRGDYAKAGSDHAGITDGTNPHNTTFANLADKPTTVSGYGITDALELGETSTTAYRGDRGKTAYDHSQITDGTNPHATTFANIQTKPTTIDGYGITDAYTKTYIDTNKADLIDGKVPANQLPSYVDDVLEVYVRVGATPAASDWLSLTDGGTALTPETGKIYTVISAGTYFNKTYRWGGTTYSLVGEMALGTTAATAFPGDRGLATETQSNNIVNGTQVLTDTRITNSAVGVSPLIIDAIASTTARLQDWKINGSSLAFISSVGAINVSNVNTNGGIRNANNTNSAFVNVSSTGTTISRNVNDTNPALIVDKKQGEGNILELHNNTNVRKLEVDVNGWLYQNGTRLFTQPVDNQSTFFGSSSGGTSTTGVRNTGYGFEALKSLTSGTDNTAIGRASMTATTTGSNNTAVGRTSLQSVVGGSSNTGVGFSSGISITSGSNNTFLGRDSGNNASQLASASNSTALGFEAYTDKSNQMVFGNASVTEFKFDRNASAIALLPQTQISSATFPPLLTERTTGITNNLIFAGLSTLATTTADMLDGYGTMNVYAIRDNANVINNIASVGAIRSGADNSGRLTLQTSNAGSLTEKMTILPNGNVGIGTNNPIHKLQISSSSGFNEVVSEMTGTGNAYTSFGLKNTARSYFMGLGANGETSLGLANKWYLFDGTASAVRMVLDTNGNVGIGTSSPASRLEVSGTGTQFVRVTSTDGSPSGVYLQRGTGADFSQDVQLLNSAGSLRIETITGTTPATTTRMIVLDTGLVGINEASPTAQLVVKSGATNRVPLIVDTLASGHTANIVEFNANNSIRFSIGPDGLIRTTNGIANMNSANNSRINIGSSGTTIQRDVADTNPALIVNLQNASATGNIQVWQKAGSAVSQISNTGIFVGQSRPTQVEQTGDYTLSLADEGKVIRANSSSNRTITIPLNSSVAFPIDTEIAVLRYGTGTVSISPTSGVTLNSKNSERKISGQYGSVALKKIGTDEWVLVGSLEA